MVNTIIAIIGGWSGATNLVLGLEFSEQRNFMLATTKYSSDKPHHGSSRRQYNF
jgi:hypothetical protein